MELVFAPDPECICHRPKCLVKCTNCGFKLFPARVHKTCEAHPLDIYLSDLHACHKCKGELLEFPEETSFPPNYNEIENISTGRSPMAPMNTKKVNIHRPRTGN